MIVTADAGNEAFRKRLVLIERKSFADTWVSIYYAGTLIAAPLVRVTVIAMQLFVAKLRSVSVCSICLSAPSL